MVMSASNYERIGGKEYYGPDHATCRAFEHSTQAFFQDEGRELIGRFGSVHSLLDIGSGAGLAQSYLGKDFAQSIYELDLNPNMMEYRYSDDETVPRQVVGDAKHLPLQDESFDAVSAFLFDPYFEATESGDSFESEAFRVLSHGGSFIGTLPSWNWASAIRYMKDMPLHGTRFKVGQDQGEEVWVPSYVVPERELISRFKHAGFSGIQTYSVYATDTSEHISKAGQYIANLTHKPDEARHVTAADKLDILTLVYAEKDTGTGE